MNAVRRPQRGHTLLELTISVALGLLVVLATISLYRGQRFAYDQATETTRLRDAASTALDLIGQQVQMAGFVPAGADPADKSPALFGCSPGRPAGSDAALVCETLASRSDGIAVRYAADTISTWPSSTGSPTDCLGQISAGERIVNRYYAKASSSTVEPELYCEGSGKPGTGQPLVEGVERLRFGYWLKDASSSVDAAAISPDRWPLVVAVDMCVLVRGDSPSATARPRYADCDGASVVSADGRVRQVFRRRIALRNVTNAPNTTNALNEAGAEP
ncbi:prepilin-type cleavage/methylation-like protein [Caballeronia udeis]|uniref:Prepilin-type cleavage/methylation-like protein n=1 Tax=Caballeronia udeis TaxID=1232866 RepID=A0A158F0B5_9BURK|nr:type IV pilus assembly protein [Caballeronia udeis]SAL13212.1 prepilin-type cleavage/methylation-like protein [Caballeronia udeis]